MIEGDHQRISLSSDHLLVHFADNSLEYQKALCILTIVPFFVFDQAHQVSHKHRFRMIQQRTPEKRLGQQQPLDTNRKDRAQMIDHPGRWRHHC